ncbi:MAG: hypothetical protein IPG78_19010 [Ignavibacteria bacterium]|nr:hypothetical protein [Ignavibacteria bacterium]
MDSVTSNTGNRLLKGVLIGIILFILAAGASSLAFFMVSILVFGCTKSPPDWVYLLVFLGFPIPLIFASIIVPYLYIKSQRTIWIILTLMSGIFISCLLFLIWFLILTQYC